MVDKNEVIAKYGYIQSDIYRLAMRKKNRLRGQDWNGVRECE